METKQIRDRLYQILEGMHPPTDTHFTVAKTMRGVAASFEGWIIRARPTQGTLTYNTRVIRYDNPQVWLIQVFSKPLGEELYTVKEDQLYAYRDLIVDTFKPLSRLEYNKQVLNMIEGVSLAGERWVWGTQEFDGNTRYKYELTLQLRVLEPC